MGEKKEKERKEERDPFQEPSKVPITDGNLTKSPHCTLKGFAVASWLN